jgi:O-antigen/teichoic acid export membrane protein
VQASLTFLEQGAAVETTASHEQTESVRFTTLVLVSQGGASQNRSQPNVLNSEQPMQKPSSSDISGTLQSDGSDRTILLAAKGGSIVFVGSVFGYGSQLVTGILLTRLMGAEQYGQYKVALIAGEIAAGLALLGLDYAMVRFVSLFVSRRDSSGLWGTLQVGVGLTTLSSLLIGAGLFASATPLALYLFHEPQLVPLLRLASLTIPFSTLSSIFGAATMGFNKMQYNVSAKQIAQPLIRLILLIPMALLGLTAGKAMVPYIVGIIVSCVLLMYFLNLLFPLRRPLNTARYDPRGLMRFSLPAYVSTLINTFGPSLQTVLLGSLNTMTTVGIFTAANQVSTASTLFNQSIGTASSPIVSELHGLEDPKKMTHFYQTTAKWMFTVNLPMFLIVLLLSEPILTIFGNEFVVGSTALNILSIANLVIAAAGISDGVLVMTGNTPAKLVNSTVQTILSMGLCILLIPRWGALGAASAVLVSSAITHLFLVSEVFFLFRMLPYTVGFLKPVVAGLVALAIGWLTRQLLHTETHLLLAAMNAFAILAAYASMILLLGLSLEDQAVFAQLRRRVATAFSRR